MVYGKKMPAVFTAASLLCLISFHRSAFAANPYESDIVSWGSTQMLDHSAIAITANNFYTAALMENGTVVAWGLNDNNRATVPAGLDSVKAIAAGGHHTVVLRENGTVVAWGRNSDGQATVPAGLDNVKAIAAGGFHTVAVLNRVITAVRK
ncbi:MAG: hypothetical protein JW925_12420 [Syntrophaceae bacterium]|nr:hypothetical protein [Syntrophaceae bacterium]